MSSKNPTVKTADRRFRKKAVLYQTALSASQTGKLSLKATSVSVLSLPWGERCRRTATDEGQLHFQFKILNNSAIPFPISHLAFPFGESGEHPRADRGQILIFPYLSLPPRGAFLAELLFKAASAARCRRTATDEGRPLLRTSFLYPVFAIAKIGKNCQPPRGFPLPEKNSVIFIFFGKNVQPLRGFPLPT